jgi:hypothetical protein
MESIFQDLPVVTISDRLDTTKDLVCIYFILISRIVSLPFKTYAYIEERNGRETRGQTNGGGPRGGGSQGEV